jgi:2'-5' RNA ligase
LIGGPVFLWADVWQNMPMAAVEKRLFTAIELPEDWLEAIASNCEALKEQGVRGRFVPPERLHLTLNFIGETAKEKEIISALTGLDRPFSPILSAGKGGLFRRKKGGDLVVWHLEPDKALEAYRESELAALEAIGLRLDQRPYTPHLTLIREAEGSFLDSDDFYSAFNLPQAFVADEAVLFWSRFVGGKLVYTPLSRYPFGLGKEENDVKP